MSEFPRTIARHLCLLVAFLPVAACDRAGSPGQDDPQGSLQGTEPVRRPGAGAAGGLVQDTLPMSAYNSTGSLEFDLDADGSDERIELLSTMEMGPDGPLGEDGAHWLVRLHDAEGSHRVFERFVPWGQVELWALREEGGARAVLVVQARSTHGPNVGTTVQKFVFDPGTGGFSRTDSIAAYGLGVHRSGIPE